MPMEMPRVKDCTVTDCSYNRACTCHTLAITVGEEEDPICDTYVEAGMSGGDADTTAGVGACKVDMCLHNRDLECTAYSIKVRLKDGHPDCQTYKNRYK